MTADQGECLLVELLLDAEHSRLRGSYREGREIAERAVTLAHGAGDDVRLAQALRLVANQSIRLGDHELGVRKAAQAAAACERVGDVAGVVDSLNIVAAAHVQLGLLDEALTSIEDSMQLLPQVDDLELRCATYNRAGTVRSEMGELRRAGELFERAERELQALGPEASNETQFCLLNNMADVVVQAIQFGDGDAVSDADVRQASARAGVAFDLAVASGNPYRQCLVAFNWAVLVSRLGDVVEAERLLSLAERLAAEGGYRGLELAVLEGRAILAQQEGAFPEAVSLWTATTQLAHELSELTVLSRAHKHASKAHEELGQLGEALTAYRIFHELEADRRSATAEVRSRLVGMSIELEQLRTEAVELGRHANQDALTGLDNRRALDAALPRLLQSADPRSWVAVCLIDVDHFKQVNDTFGHAIGDDVLRALGRLLLGEARRGDVVARIGGEELALSWEVALSDPTEVAEAVRSRVERVRAVVAAQPWGSTAIGLAVTVSLGAVAMRVSQRPLPSVLLAGADELLYAAKSAGRNRAVSRVAVDDGN